MFCLKISGMSYLKVFFWILKNYACIGTEEKCSSKRPGNYLNVNFKIYLLKYSYLAKTWPLKKMYISCTGPSCLNWFPDFLLVKQNSFTQFIQWTVRINRFWQLGSVHKIHIRLEATSPFEFSHGLIQLEDFYRLNWSLVSFSLRQDDFILKRGTFNIASILVLHPRCDLYSCAGRGHIWGWEN